MSSTRIFLRSINSERDSGIFSIYVEIILTKYINKFKKNSVLGFIIEHQIDNMEHYAPLVF